MEYILSGYCRVQDQPRTVMLDNEDGPWQADCNYPDCAYSNVCQLAKEIDQKIQD